MLLIGNGIRLSRAEAEMEQLLRALDIPAEVTWLAIDMMADDDPLYVGRPGTLAQRGSQLCDTELRFPPLHRSPPGPCRDRICTGGLCAGRLQSMVDIDPAELRKMGNTIHFPICADAGDFIRAMLAQAANIERKERSALEASAAPTGESVILLCCQSTKFQKAE